MKRLSILFLLLLVCVSCNDDDLIIKEQDLSVVQKLGCLTEMLYGTDNDGFPIGGGTGYQNSIETGTLPAVRSLEALKNTLENAQNGDVVFIPGDVELIIDTMDYFRLPIKMGVTLASDRGVNGSCGALIKFTENAKNSSVFAIAGENSRITGLRLEGPSGDILPVYQKRGITTDGYNNILIDNNEIYNWPFEAIQVTVNKSHNRYSTEGIVIRNNYIHDNVGQGIGYGVGIGGGFLDKPNPFALVKGNLFERNRHAVASSGFRNSGYEASYNVIKGNNTGHNFDVHGGKDRGWTGGNADIAGSFTYIHHNIFFDHEFASIVLRGIPTYMALITNNKFVHKINDAIVQGVGFKEVINNDTISRVANYKLNVFAWNNVYQCTTDGYQIIDGKYMGTYVSKNTKNYGVLPTYVTPGPDRNGDVFDDFEMMDFALGDFDGNGITEIFKIEDGYWYTTNIPEPESGSFPEDWGVSINNAPSIEFSRLIFEDFDGNGKTDVFKTNLSDWHISYGATTGWQDVNSSGLALSQLAFGDFDGNGKADVFKTNLVDWHISKGANTGWEKVNSSGVPFEQLAFGDFNGDGKTDVFKSNLTDWHYSNGADSGWEELALGNGESVDNLFFVDINNDGQDDVLIRDSSGFYKVSWSGSTNWRWLNYKSYPDLLNQW